MLGQLLCCCGWHSWEFFDLAQRGNAGNPVVVRTYCTCRRGCGYGMQVVNLEINGAQEPIRTLDELATELHLGTRRTAASGGAVIAPDL
jgi:hypothetical protein